MSASSTKKPWVNVAVFEKRDDTGPLESFLNQHRIETRVYNDRVLQAILFLCPPHATYRVQVRANAARAVTELLEREPETPVLAQRALHCPSCDSLTVNYPQMTRKFFLPTLVLHIGILLRVIHHEAYCEKCHHTWELPPPDKRGLPQVKVASH
ncbi:MAG TPA: hypothetical protein VG347_03900 [Verrucomicrobiae bacterium]|nr:hypothetical protein [Verrucomicrobiae bacterium]